MSRRDALIKVAARAASPEYLDMTRFRQRSSADGVEIQASRQDVLGAMAFSARDWRAVDSAGNVVAEGEGNPLLGALLRLKYHAPRDREAFDRAHLLLLERHVDKTSDTMYAVATAALFEWVFDRCPVCCGGARPGHFPREPEKKRRAAPFLLCSRCGNSRRATWTIGERYRFVRESLDELDAKRREGRRLELARARFHGLPPPPFPWRERRALSFRAFRVSWHRRYLVFLELLRQADKRIGKPLDIQVSRLENLDIEPRRIVVAAPIEREPRPKEEQDAGAVPVLQDGGAQPVMGKVSAE